MSDKPAPPEPSALRSMISMLPLLLLTTYLCYARPGADPGAKMKLCGESLHKIGVELEKAKYTSGDQTYPKTLKEAFGEKDIPKCPEGGNESYIDGYSVKADQKSYILVCSGAHHKEAGVPSGYPRIAFGASERSNESPSTEPTPAVSGTPAVSEATATPEVSKATATPSVEATPKTVETKPNSEETPAVVETPSQEKKQVPKEGQKEAVQVSDGSTPSADSN